MSLVDITEDAVLLLRAIEQTKGKFGLNVPIDVLLGRKNARITKHGLDGLSSHGSGSHKSEDHWKNISQSLVRDLLVDSRSLGKGFGKGKMKAYSVSNLGQKLLQGGNQRVKADLAGEAEMAECERAAATARRGGRASAANAVSSPPSSSKKATKSAARSTSGGEWPPLTSEPEPASEWTPKREGTQQQQQQQQQSTWQPHLPQQQQQDLGHSVQPNFSQPQVVQQAFLPPQTTQSPQQPQLQQHQQQEAGHFIQPQFSQPQFMQTFRRGAQQPQQQQPQQQQPQQQQQRHRQQQLEHQSQQHNERQQQQSPHHQSHQLHQQDLRLSPLLPTVDAIEESPTPMQLRAPPPPENPREAKRRRPFPASFGNDTAKGTDSTAAPVGYGGTNAMTASVAEVSKASVASTSSGGTGGAAAASWTKEVLGTCSRPQPAQGHKVHALPTALEDALMPFQREGLAFAVGRAGRVLFGDEMGLGKTIQAIATCCAFRDDWPVLIIVPNSVRLVWADELERWIPDLGPEATNVVKSSSDLISTFESNASFHIVTYGILTRDSPGRNILRERSPFGTIVVDESHMIKNRDAMRTREILKIASQAKRVILLSGTPALARPLELWPQIEAIEPGLFKSFTTYTKRYCAPKMTPFGMDLTGSSNLQELHQHLRPIMIRRLKNEVLTDLPDKRRQRIQIDVGRSGVDMCSDLKTKLGQVQESEPVEKNRLLMELYQESSRLKEGPAAEYVEDLLQGGCKFLVFAHHLSMLDALEAAAKKCQASSIRIDGGVNAAERHRRVKSFQSNETVRVAILGIQAAGVGITLTAASTVLFAELHWTPGVLVQAEDRAHRIGQKSSVNVQYLVAPGTIDDIMWPMVSRKVQVVSAMCDGRKDRLVAGLSSADQAVSNACADMEMSEVMAELNGGKTDMDSLIVAGESPGKPSPPQDPAQDSVAALLLNPGKRPKKHKAPAAPPPDDRWAFCISPTVGRIHVMGVDDRPLGWNFKLADWQAVGGRAAFPPGVLQDATMALSTETFCREWVALKAKDQRELVGQTLRLPLSKYVQKAPPPSRQPKDGAPQKPPGAGMPGSGARYQERYNRFQLDGKDGDGNKFSMQVTVRAAGGCVDEAQCIADLCWQRSQEGASKQELEGYRNELCEAAVAKLAARNAKAFTDFPS